MTFPTPNELAERIDRLAERYDAPWQVVKEPHDYNDGTTHFTHVEYITAEQHHDNSTVRVADTVTPALAELLCLLHNNIHTIVAALRSPAGQREGLSEDKRLGELIGIAEQAMLQKPNAIGAPFNCVTVNLKPSTWAEIALYLRRLSASPPEPTS